MTISQPHLSRPKYRQDIDGLRGVAVLSVVAFHAFPAWMKGGFTGVDVFFVISGFLISTIILENLGRETFSFSEFYARRIRRIFPALLVVLIASYGFGWFALLADEYKQLGKHVAAGAGFVSNFVLWRESGYFDNVSETKPLLHLWSLGIEEQFYIVWPFLLWLTRKRQRSSLILTLVIAIISLASNIKGIRQDAVAAFYSPHTRFWELLSGSIVAWFAIYKKERDENAGINIGGRTGSHILSFLGIALLAYGFARIDKSLNFPGTWAMVPVSGAVLIIVAGPGAWINRRLLSNKVAVWLGLISFPLYLWHWPLLSFARIIESEVPSRQIRIAAVVLSIILAWLTYTFIERPIRFGKRGKATTVALVSCMLVLGYIGHNTYRRDGLRFRSNATLEGYSGDIGHLDYHKFIAEKYFTCTPDVIAKEALRWEGFIRCIQSKPDSNINIAIVGDSHAEHLFLGIAEALQAKNVVFYIKGSAPFIDNHEFKNIFKTILESKSINHVIVTMSWHSRYSQVPAGSTLDKELIKVIDALTSVGKEVYLTDDVPTFSFTPDKCKGKRWLSTKDASCEMSVEESKKQTAIYNEALEAVVKNRPTVKILSVGKYFCNEKICRMTKGHEILYRDSNHLNLKGSLDVGKRLIEDNSGLFK